MRLLVVVATMLAETYGLAPGAPLPTVAFSPHHGRAHRFRPAPYLFQYREHHLSDVDITACMRFLLHGMIFRTREGKPVVLKAHLLRHAFATHAVHVEKIPVDIVGEWLKQKSLDVTDYYSQPTEGMVADAADRFLARIAAHVHVGDAVRRSPTELRALYEAEGITSDKEIIAYCRIGERSSHTWFALQELLGFENVKNYDGSWTEYGSLVGAPVELGERASSARPEAGGPKAPGPFPCARAGRKGLFLLRGCDSMPPRLDL